MHFIKLKTKITLHTVENKVNVCLLPDILEETCRSVHFWNFVFKIFAFYALIIPQIKKYIILTLRNVYLNKNITSS